MSTQTINLFDLGCLVQLSVGTWSGRRMLTRQDLTSVGIDPTSLPDEIINLGRKLLVPKAELLKFSQIMQKARGYLINWSIPFGIGSAQFVPANMLADVQAKLDGCQQEFYEVVDSFIERFDTMSRTIKDQYPEFWSKCLRKHYPASAALLRSYFYFKHFAFQVSGLGGTEEVSAKEAHTRWKIDQEREKEMKAEMKAEVHKFVEEAVTILRGETVDFCDLVIARVNNKPYKDEDKPKEFPPRTLACFRKYVDRFKQMNIFGDDEIEKMLTELKDTYFSDRTPTELQTPNVAKSLTEACESIRKLAAAENGEMSAFLGRVKRKIEI